MWVWVPIALTLIVAVTGCESRHTIVAVETVEFKSSLAKRKKKHHWIDYPSFGSGMAYEQREKQIVLLSDGVRVKKNSFRYPIGLLSEVRVGAKIKTRWITLQDKYDFEGIAFDPDGNLWLADEYRPSLLQLSYPELKKIRMLKPNAGLPAYYKNIQPGRGFEGLTVTNAGVVVAVLQSALRLSNVTSLEHFIRVIAFEPVQDRFTEYRYDPEYPAADTKIGAITHISENQFAALEHGYESGAGAFAFLCFISLPEQKRDSASQDINRVIKDQCISFGSLGIPIEKPEGLVYLEEDHMLMLTNDADEKKKNLIYKVFLNRDLYHYSNRLKKLVTGR